MKKTFNLDSKNIHLWPKLVDLACASCTSLQLNILFKKPKPSDLLFKQGKVLKPTQVSNKFYITGEVLKIQPIPLDEDIIVQLRDFYYWENNELEDPSFWVEDQEALACITHEGIVLVDLALISCNFDNVELFNFNGTD